MNADLVSEAIVVWTGWGEAAWPTREDRRLIERWGSDEGQELVDTVHSLVDEFYDLDAHRAVAELAEMSAVAAARFHALHPELSDDAVTALAWCYSFDYK